MAACAANSIVRGSVSPEREWPDGVDAARPTVRYSALPAAIPRTRIVADTVAPLI